MRMPSGSLQHLLCTPELFYPFIAFQYQCPLGSKVWYTRHDHQAGEICIDGGQRQVAECEDSCVTKQELSEPDSTQSNCRNLPAPAF